MEDRRPPSISTTGEGFTLVELIAVMAIIGIIAAVVGPRFFDTDTFAAEGFANDVRASLRYARTRAVTSGCNTYFRLSSTGYRVARWQGGSDCNDRAGSLQTLLRPTGGDFTAPKPARITVGAAELFFDPIGRPRNISGALISSVTAILVGESTVQVQPESGLVN